MKTAVSLPDQLFREAELAAKSLCVSRSQLYASAIAEYLERRKDQSITERLNEVYGRQNEQVDRALALAQLRSLDKESW